MNPAGQSPGSLETSAQHLLLASQAPPARTKVRDASKGRHWNLFWGRTAHFSLLVSFLQLQDALQIRDRDCLQRPVPPQLHGWAGEGKGKEAG